MTGRAGPETPFWLSLQNHGLTLVNFHLLL